jgi:hypothetical protein
MSALSSIASGAGHYVHWGVISISLTNLLVVLAMIALFVLALVVPFWPAARDGDNDDRSRL